MKPKYIINTEADELYELYLLDNGTIWGYNN